ncbi:MAG TPA: isoprenylcysteine carboxylmethyltransferase family protein [Chitinophagaceae bacterium]|jgi:protein-S-isoprenylcysteine O-methyltransferase Ste14
MPTYLKEASMAGLILAMVSAASLVFLGAIFGNNFGSVSVQIMAGVLMLWARWTMGRRSFHASANPTEGGLVNFGPYRFLRHPIYASILYFVWAGLSSHFSVINFVFTLTVSLGLLIRMRAEEILMLEKYPGYKAYANKTKRILPFIY